MEMHLLNIIKGYLINVLQLCYFNALNKQLGVCIQYIYQQLGKSVINGLNGGKKTLAVEYVSHIDSFN
jgi:hypothetical protein